MTLLSALLSLSVFTHFNCTLDLNLIEDTNSSETKQLIFDVELTPEIKNICRGNMIITSCFGTFVKPFVSSSSQINIFTIGDLTYGSFNDSFIAIEDHHYQLTLGFSQLIKNPEDAKTIDFIASGRMLPLDHDSFIHQHAVGECHLRI